jgi:hypothetical protein
MTATVPKIKTLFVNPFIRRAGIPNPTKRITKSIGIPRKISTYAVAKILKGNSAGDLDVLVSAIIIPKIATQVEAITVSNTFVLNPKIILGSTSTP